MNNGANDQAQGGSRKRQKSRRTGGGSREQPASGGGNSKYYGPPATINGVAQLLESAGEAPPSMPLLLRLLDVKPLPDIDDASMALSEAKASDDERTCRVMLFTSALESGSSAQQQAQGATGGTTGGTTSELPGDFSSTHPTSHLVFVNGFYVSSERGCPSNAPSAPPATLFLSDIELVYTVRGEDERQRRAEAGRQANRATANSSSRKNKKQKREEASDAGNGNEEKNNKKGATGNSSTAAPVSTVKGGMVGEFFSMYAPRLTDVELAGFAVAATPSTGTVVRSPTRTIINAATGGSLLDQFPANKQKVDEMLARHGAMLTLLSSQSSSSGSGTNSPSNQPNSTRSRSQSNAADVAAAEIYLSALREFNTSQMDRQNAGLTSNVGRADAVSAELIKKQHRAALQAALDHAENTKEPLTIDLLCEWHKLLCGAGVHKEAGKLRKKSVRAGRKTFAKPERVREELEKVIEGLQELERRLVANRLASHDGQGPLIFAAAALFGIVDIHPFVDGNGRLCRIVANWCLRRARFPFPINFIVTKAQRREYISAIQETNGATHLHYRGVKAEQEGSMTRLDVLRTTGCFSPIVCLIADRLARAFSEFRREEADKANLASEESEARAARNARERAAEGDCIICFDEKPNIATLCCGKAVHLNCIAEWLGSNESCPFCRSTIPRLETTRTQRPARSEEDDGIDHNTDEFDFTTTTVEEDEAPTNDTTQDDHDTTTISADEDEAQNDTTTEVDESADQDHDTNSTTEDHDTTAVSDANEQDHDINSTTADHDTTAVSDADEQEDETADQDHDTNSTTEDHDTTAVSDANEQDHDINSTTADHDTTAVSDADEQEDETADQDHDTNSTTEDHDTTPGFGGVSDTSTSIDGGPEASSNATASQHRRCDCGNRNAIDCSNNACGRCCVLYGTYRCSRHST